MRRTPPVPLGARAAAPLRYGSQLLIDYPVHYFTWQFDPEWLRRTVYPWNIVGSFGP
jgi:hypothetical protein